MGKYILSLDSGTTSNRAVLFDHFGKVAGISQKEFGQIFPGPGMVEHNPEEIWESQFGVISDLFKKKGVKPLDVSGIGITNQRETTLVWDRESGRPVCNAIVWQDRRTAEFCNELISKGLESVIKEKTGLVIDAYFSASKIRWILDNVDGAREKAEQGKLAFGTIDTWIVWKLTAGKIHVTDASNASRTMIYNIHTLEWDRELMEIIGIPESLLPEVKSSSEVYGTTVPELFGTAIPIAGIAGDQQAALFGQACMEKGMAKNTYGTGCFVVMNTGEKAISSNYKLLTTIAWKIGDKVNYALEGSIFIGGTVIQWLRDKMRIIKTSGEIEELARKVENNGGVVFVPAFVGLGAPDWDPYATGTIIGINRDTSDAHIARAALEAIALRSLDVIRTMELDSGITLKELRVDGGAAVNNLLMQIQANLLQKNVIRPAITETTALGAAYLAGLATGFWSGIDEIRLLWKEDAVFNPAGDTESIQKLIGNWTSALERSRNWNPIV